MQRPEKPAIDRLVGVRPVNHGIPRFRVVNRFQMVAQQFATNHLTLQHDLCFGQSEPIAFDSVGGISHADAERRIQ